MALRHDERHDIPSAVSATPAQTSEQTGLSLYLLQSIPIARDRNPTNLTNPQDREEKRDKTSGLLIRGGVVCTLELFDFLSFFFFCLICVLHPLPPSESHSHLQR